MQSRRLSLEPLTVGHAVEMVGVLADQDLYQYIGGEPPSLQQLENRYVRQAVGYSPDGAYGWLNWIIRRRDSGAAIGFTQATIARTNSNLAADLAWLVSPAHQGHGLATEAVTTMCAWLRRHGIARLAAHVHPDNEPSAAVARHVGMHVTDMVLDGEQRWEA